MPQNAWTLSYHDVIGLCRLAYKKNGTAKTSYLIANRKWTITEVDIKGPYRGVLLEGTDLLNKPVKVVSFSGTDELRDWSLGGNIGNALKGAEHTRQYLNGLAFAQKIKPNYLTGHSLGGGIALFCCVKLSIRTATINPSPLFNDVFGTQFNKFNNTSFAFNYCVPGEILESARNLAKVGKFGLAVGATPGTQIIVQSTASKPVDKHLLANLAGFVEPVQIK